MIHIIGYLLIYSLTDFMNGLTLQTPGPLIPFLAAHAHIKPTSYYFVYISRAVGAIVAAFIYKILESKGLAANHHKILGFSSIIYFISLIAFSFWHSLVGTGVLFGIYAGLYFVQNLTMSMCLIAVPPKQKIFLWAAISNGSFGIGCLLAPIMVDIFINNTFAVSSIPYLVMIVAYLFIMKSPLQKQKEREEIQGNAQKQNTTSTLKDISTKLAVYLGVNFFIVHGLEMMNGGWISSYAVLAKIATKKQAALFATAFWLVFSVSLLALSFIKSKDSTKLKRVTELGVLSALVCLVLSFLDYKLAAASCCAVLQGASVSAMYSVLLAISSEYNLKVPDEVLSTIMIVMMSSQAFMVGLTGYLMKVVALKMLFISLFVFNLIMCVNSRYVIYLHEKQEVVSREDDHSKIEEKLI